MPIRSAVAIMLAIATAGCASNHRVPVDPLATSTTLRAACAAQHESLDATVTCLEVELDRHSAQQGTQDEISKLYVAFGRAQAQRVRNGELTDAQGWTEWDDSARTLRDIAALRRSLEPAQMSMLSKIGYVLQATAAGARAGRAEALSTASQTLPRAGRLSSPVPAAASGLEHWQPSALSGDPGHTINSFPIESLASAQDGCRKAWVCDDHGQNCGVHDLCDSITATPSVGLAPLRPLPSVEIKPLPSIAVPPLGTTACEYKQVDGEWRNVCR